MEDYELPWLQKQFAAVNTADLASLREWFLAFPELTAREQARVAQVALITIRRWRKKSHATFVYMYETYHGVVCVRPRTPNYRPPKKPLPNLVVPENWATDPNWLLAQIENKVSIRQLAKLTKASRSWIDILIRAKRAARAAKAAPGFLQRL